MVNRKDLTIKKVPKVPILALKNANPTRDKKNYRLYKIKGKIRHFWHFLDVRVT